VDCTAVDVQSGLATSTHKQWVMMIGGEECIIDLIAVATTHVPKNEREYNRSPDKSMWRTSRELKMDQYKSLNIYKLVNRKDIPAGARVMSSLWVHGLKEKPDPTTKKLRTEATSRWCVKGTGMPADVYESFFDCARRVSINIMACILATYAVHLIECCADVKNFFQSTRTDVVSADKKALPRLFCSQPPSFVEKGPNGEELVAELLVALQGRTDAGRISGQALATLIMSLKGVKQSQWDPRVYILHIGPLAGTASSIDEIFASIAAAEYEPQQPPPGWMMLATHVDDIPHIYTRYHDGRIAKYLWSDTD
jgi:hypothetical protein